MGAIFRAAIVPSSNSVVIDDRDVVRVAAPPGETNPPLVVDADTVEVATIRYAPTSRGMTAQRAGATDFTSVLMMRSGAGPTPPLARVSTSTARAASRRTKSLQLTTECDAGQRCVWTGVRSP